MKNLGCVLVVMFALIGFAHAGDPVYQVEARVGGISSDNLGGIGGSKATADLAANVCFSYVCAGASVWSATEPMDDDVGIVPRKGYTLEATNNPSKILLYGVHYRQNDFFNQTSAMIGVSYGPIRLAVLAPLSSSQGSGRTGFIGAIRAPLTKQLYAVAQFDYYGTQDPDTKVSQIGLGIGYTFEKSK